uniref:Uncharacterized protein n=1 Tax=Lepeophtheirus salmonis TaxID=72036 RepID=A0A0K2SXD0_LEPSM
MFLDTFKMSLALEYLFSLVAVVRRCFFLLAFDWPHKSSLIILRSSQSSS